METLEDALDSLSQKRKKFLVEKEELEDLKEEMADYQEVCVSNWLNFMILLSAGYLIPVLTLLLGSARTSKCCSGIW